MGAHTPQGGQGYRPPPSYAPGAIVFKVSLFEGRYNLCGYILFKIRVFQNMDASKHFFFFLGGGWGRRFKHKTIYNLAQWSKKNLNRNFKWRSAMQRWQCLINNSTRPWKLCMIKYELDIIVYHFEIWLFSIIWVLSKITWIFLLQKRIYQN